MSVRTRIFLACAVIALAGAGVYLAYRHVDPRAREHHFIESAKKFEASGKYREASIQYLNAINIDPRSVEAHRGLGFIALKLSDPDSAYFEFQQTIELDPADMAAHLNYGNLLLGRSQVKEAKHEAELVLSKEPQNPEAHLLMAQVDIVANEAENAKAEIEKSRQLDPKSPKPLIVLATLQQREGKFADAVNSYKQALAVSSDDVDALLGIGSAYERQQKWVDAEAAYRKAIQIAPTDASPWTSLMVQFIFQGKYAEAEAVAREAKQKLPNAPAAYRMLADYYIATRQLPKALEEMSALVKSHESDWRLKRDYVQQLIFANRLDEATALNDELLTLVGNNPQSMIQKGQIQLRRGDAAGAVVTIKTALRDQPENYIGHFYLGVALGATGDAEGAERELQESIKLQPRGPQAQVFLSDLAAKTGKRDLLDDLSKRLLTNFPLAANSYLVRATYLASHNQWSEAEKSVRRAIEIDPNNPVAYAKLAELRIVKKDFTGGISYLQQSLDVDPNFVTGLKVLVALDLSRSGVPQATQRVEIQLQKAPNNSAYHSLLGGLYLRSNRNSDALVQFQTAVELDKHNGDAWELLGKTQTSLGHPEEMMTTYQKWVEADPKQAGPHVLLGQIWESKGDWKQAEAEYHQALKLDEHNGIAANNMAYLLLDHDGDKRYALTLAMEARRQYPESAVTLDTLGWAYYFDGQYQLAASILEAAAKRTPKSATVHFHLASVYAKLKDWNKALSHYEEALALDPKSPLAAETRKALAEIKAHGSTVGGQ